MSAAFALFAVLFALPPSTRAQGAAAAPKVAIVILEESDQYRVQLALHQASYMASSGIDTRLIFEGKGVLTLAEILEPAGREKVKKALADAGKGIPAGGPFDQISRSLAPVFEKSPALFAKARENGVKVSASEASARFFGFFDDLSKAGIKMEGDAKDGLNWAPLVQQGYRIIVF